MRQPRVRHTPAPSLSPAGPISDPSSAPGSFSFRGLRLCGLPVPAPPLLPVLLLALVVGLGCEGTDGPGVTPEDPGGEEARNPVLPLRFQPDRTFTIVQFTDTQDDQDLDPRTVRLLEAVLDDQRPDLVVFTGDNIRSGPETRGDVWRAIRSFAEPVDSREIPWLVTFGNHDEDHTSLTGVDEEAMLEHYRSYAYNVNRPGPQGVHGTGNMHLLVHASDSPRPVLAIWALDSGRYFPDSVAEQALEADGLPGWDVIHPTQVAWYHRTSTALEEDSGRPVPGLAFFHIPLWEFRFMWEAREHHGVVGEKNEGVSSGPFNSGLFAAMLERGDVRGVFVGHDHVNDYVGDYFGIRLGYAANAGFGTYGLDGEERDRLRGARVFVVGEEDPAAFETFMVYARDYGIQ